LEGSRVLIQGAGNVGRDLAERLHHAGAEIMVSEVNQAALAYLREDLYMRLVSTDEVYDTPCDLFSPCAEGGVLSEKTIPRLRCSAVVGAADNQLGIPEDALRLQERKIVYVPDFVANSGGAIGLTGMRTKGWSRDRAMEKIVRSIKSSVSQIFKLAVKEGITTDEAARGLAETRISGKKQ
jgi:leucine dehydrogenase